jgi:hypothetical protein
VKKLTNHLKDYGIMIKYRGLIILIGVDPTGAVREFYRYFLFQEKLREFKIRSEDVKSLIPLLDFEHKTLSSYIAQKPFAVWIWTTTGGILAT